MFLTTKQTELLKIIQTANDDGGLVDLDQLIERASYKPSKASMQFSIRALVARDLIEKAGNALRRDRRRVLLRIRPLGMHLTARLNPTPTFVISEEEDKALSEIEL